MQSLVLEVVSKPPEHDHRTSDSDHRPEHTSMSLLADKESPEVEQPGDGSLYDPTFFIPSKLSAILE